jgi:multidrug efflux system membrane fusion protein
VVAELANRSTGLWGSRAGRAAFMLRACGGLRLPRNFIWAVLLWLFLLSFLWLGCRGKSSPQADAPMDKMRGGAIPVVVSRVVKKDMPVDIQAVGNVEASSTVTVKSQVSGELIRVLFKEGNFVKKGEELFEIDARSYEAQLNQVQANLAKDEAVLAQAEANLTRDLAQQKYAQSEALRYSNLFDKHLVSKEQTEQANMNADANAAAVQADQAAIRSARSTAEATRAAIANARVMLSYTKIQSPLDGRTGNLDVKQGNVISPNTALMTINQVEPIYVSFAVPENQLRAVKKGQKITASLQDGFSAPNHGELFFIDNAVDTTTGTVRLKATFPNRDQRLWPGQFVKVKIQLDTKYGVLVVPNQAVQTGQDGSYVFVVKPDRKVESRPIVTGIRQDQDIIIEKGLEPGEIVVTEGQLRLAVGSLVQFSDSGGR